MQDPIEGEFDVIRISHMVISYNEKTRLWDIEFRTPARFLVTSLTVGNSLQGYASPMLALAAGAAFIDQNKKMKAQARITIWLDRYFWDVHEQTADPGYRFFCPKCYKGFSLKEKQEQYERNRRIMERKKRVHEKLKRKETDDLFNVDDL